MWVIYNIDTTQIVCGNHSRGYQTKAVAKAVMTRMQVDRDTHAICEYHYFVDHIEKKEVRHGAVYARGKKYVVSVNTPWTSGPWSETYWSQ